MPIRLTALLPMAETRRLPQIRVCAERRAHRQDSLPLRSIRVDVQYSSQNYVF